MLSYFQVHIFVWYATPKANTWSKPWFSLWTCWHSKSWSARRAAQSTRWISSRTTSHTSKNSSRRSWEIDILCSNSYSWRGICAMFVFILLLDQCSLWCYEPWFLASLYGDWVHHMGTMTSNLQWCIIYEIEEIFFFWALPFLNIWGQDFDNNHSWVDLIDIMD